METTFTSSQGVRPKSVCGCGPPKRTGEAAVGREHGDQRLTCPLQRSLDLSAPQFFRCNPRPGLQLASRADAGQPGDVSRLCRADEKFLRFDVYGQVQSVVAIGFGELKAMKPLFFSKLSPAPAEPPVRGDIECQLTAADRLACRIMDFDLQVLGTHIKGLHDQDKAIRFFPDCHELVPPKQFLQIGGVTGFLRSLGWEVSGQAF